MNTRARARARASRTVRGFTLLEVMAASAMLGVGLAAVLSASSTMTGMFSHFEQETAALSVADGFIEDLVLAPRTSALLESGAHERRVDELGAAAADGAFTLRWHVESGAPIAGMRRIVVDVIWQERGTTRKVTLRTARD